MSKRERDTDLGHDLRLAIANWNAALKNHDLDEVHRTQAVAAAVMREVLQGLGGAYDMNPEQLCVVTMMALSRLARNVDPQIRQQIAVLAAVIDMEDGSRA
jgi:hypothetical protein